MKLALEVKRIIESIPSTVGDYDDGYTTVMYGTTPIVRFNDREIILNSGGWHTRSTCTRMNQISREHGLPFSVRRERGTLMVEVGDRSVPLRDGMRIARG